jgi:Putative addiction module component
MNQRIKTLFQDAQKLEPADREELAELLLATIEADPDLDAAWGDEAHRRWDEHSKSGETPIDAFSAVEDARAEIARRGK